MHEYNIMCIYSTFLNATIAMVVVTSNHGSSRVLLGHGNWQSGDFSHATHTYVEDVACTPRPFELCVRDACLCGRALHCGHFGTE